MRLPLFLGIPWFKDLNYMQNNRNRSDFADAHTNLSTDAVTPLRYLLKKNYHHVYLYTYRLAEYADVSEAGKNKSV